MQELELEQREGSVRLSVRVQPRASRDAIAGVHEGALKVALTAPPVEGEANAALVQLLAKVLGVAKRDVRLVAGEKSRRKTLEIIGVDVAQVRAKLGASRRSAR